MSSQSRGEIDGVLISLEEAETDIDVLYGTHKDLNLRDRA